MKCCMEVRFRWSWFHFGWVKRAVRWSHFKVSRRGLCVGFRCVYRMRCKARMETHVGAKMKGCLGLFGANMKGCLRWWLWWVGAKREWVRLGLVMVKVEEWKAMDF